MARSGGLSDEDGARLEPWQPRLEQATVVEAELPAHGGGVDRPVPQALHHTGGQACRGHREPDGGHTVTGARSHGIPPPRSSSAVAMRRLMFPRSARRPTRGIATRED